MLGRSWADEGRGVVNIGKIVASGVGFGQRALEITVVPTPDVIQRRINIKS